VDSKFHLLSRVGFEKLLRVMQEAQLDSALCEALHHDSVRFVQLLVDQGASCDRLRRLINIAELYKKTVSKS
jgi:hypothetical protein